MNLKEKLLLLLGALSIVFVALFAVLYFFSQSAWNGQVTGLDWKREWDVIRYQKIGGKCWYTGCAPPRSYALQERREVHHWDRVKTGETCTGSGEERRCSPTYTSYPVHATRVYYTVNDWALGRIAKSEGRDNKNVFWPELNLLSCDPLLPLGTGPEDPLLGCEKEGSQRQRYFVSLKANDEEILPGHCRISYAPWTDTILTQPVSGKFWTYQRLIDCNSLDWSKK